MRLLHSTSRPAFQITPLFLRTPVAAFSLAIILSLCTFLPHANAQPANTQPPSTSPAPPLQPQAAPTPPTPAKAPLKVLVSIPPLKSLVEPLLPPGSTIGIIIPPGVSEHAFEPSPSTLAAIAKADLVILVGRGLEPDIEKFIASHPSPTRSVIIFADIISLPPSTPAPAQHNHVDHAHHANHADHTHQDKQNKIDHHAPKDPAHVHDHNHDPAHVHDDSCTHNHGDPHLWLDPIFVKQLILHLDTTLNGPPGPSLAAAHLIARVNDIDLRYKALFAVATRTHCIVGHDAWGLLASRYGFTTIPIAGLHASEPTPKALAAALSAAKDHNATVIFTEPQLSDAAAKRIAKLTKLSIRQLDALGSGDWFVVMENNLAAFTFAFSTPQP